MRPFLALVAAWVCLVHCSVHAATAYIREDNSCNVAPGLYTNGSATGSFTNSIDTTGWSSLTLTTTDGSSSTLDQARAVGCLEAYFTHHLMYLYWDDYAVNSYKDAQPGTKLVSWMMEQEAWLRSQIAAKAPSGKPYWVGMQHVMAQFDGLVAGYQEFAPPSETLNSTMLYMLNSMGDLEDLNGVLADAQPLSEVRIPNSIKDTDCSGFIKVLPGNADIVVGHSTWRDFYQMIRVYKVYHLGYAPAQTVSMSSSPGFLHSKDDFYATPNTIVIETTNSIFNKALYDKLTTKCALSWQRAAVATEWATTGVDWTTLFAFLNSGTYNNQWMVVDTSLFTPGQDLPEAGVLSILEQIPGLTQAGDMTSTLRSTSYWGSYNIPYFPEIYNASGYPAMVAKYGSPYSYDQCQRANIFRRNQTSVRSIEDVQNLMRYNNYKHDPLSLGDPVLGAVCARGDLQSSDPVPFGCVDSKVTSAIEGYQSVRAVSGPTHVQQPVFVFDPKFATTMHAGVVNEWDFQWTSFPA